ncbi:intradiol ring-cleavage dioxygenase [Myxococcus sp. AM011]|uniref:dioxygenase family protein n=1 Tax=Myxococcus sp. AM011 TaxID=2745200 RepID=UPI0015960BB8|nr:intradiol ring-cleavage dioxygenase [Myxococcus sp. AM011]NVJ24291.1 intradiol ring-cleavage dioxygenase [Myxococcus sp. AM011]
MESFSWTWRNRNPGTGHLLLVFMSVLSRRSVLLGLGACAAGVQACTCAAPAEAVPVAPRVRARLYTCEGCEAVAERGPERLAPFVQLASGAEPGERMTLTGCVLSAESREPVAEVVIYAHHTNAAGLYANGTQESEWSRRHGRLRGWARTGGDGVYAFDTIKPAPYPNDTLPAHVHLFIGEPGRPPYYVDDVVFDGEFGVTPEYRARQEFRGGSGIVKLSRTAEGVWLARRDIVLERHP